MILGGFLWFLVVIACSCWFLDVSWWFLVVLCGSLCFLMVLADSCWPLLVLGGFLAF